MYRVVIAVFMTIATSHAAAAESGSSPAAQALTRLLASGRLPAERRGTVVELICSRGGPDDLATVLAGTVAGNYEPDVQRRVLELLTDATVTRKVRPSGDLSIIEKVVHAPTADRETRLAAVRLASVWRVTAIADELTAAALDASADPALRQAALEGLALFGDASSKAALVKLAGDGNPTPIRTRAAAALAKLDLAAAAGAAAGAVPDVTSIDEIAPLLDAFLTRKGGPDKLATALREKPLPADAAKLALRHMYSVGRSDAALSDVLGKAAGIGGAVTPPTPDEMKQLVAEVAAQGSAERGEQVFRRADLSCLKCHAVSRAGGSIGPELSAIGSISPVDYLVNSIVDPNLAIKEQFVTRVIVTADGETFTGIVVDRDEVRVNLKDAAGKLVTIPTADIDEEAEGKSLMPQGLTKFLTRQELIDVVRFLSELGKPGPYAIRKTPTIQRWRVLKQPPAAIAGDVPDAARLKQFVLSAPAEAWVPAYGQVGGDLPLTELVRPGEAVFLQGEIEVVTPGEIEFYTTPHDGVVSWLDGALIAKSATIQISRGRHVVTVRARRDAAVSHQTLRMELRKPPGSKAQFDVVGGS